MDKVATDHSLMQRPVHLSFGQVKPFVDRYKCGWMGKKIKEQNEFSKMIDMVSYASKVSENGSCVFVVHFRSPETLKVCQLA